MIVSILLFVGFIGFVVLCADIVGTEDRRIEQASRMRDHDYYKYL